VKRYVTIVSLIIVIVIVIIVIFSIRIKKHLIEQHETLARACDFIYIYKIILYMHIKFKLTHTLGGPQK